jgi:phosphoribosylformylglycinamidine synthase
MLCGGEQTGPKGATWAYDPAMEREFTARALATSRKSAARSARLIAGGGAAVALAKEAIASGVGMRVDFGDGDAAELLFSEGGPRALYFVPPDCSDKFLALWEGYPLISLGRTGGDSLQIQNVLEIGLDELESAFSSGGLLDYDPKRLG